MILNFQWINSPLVLCQSNPGTPAYSTWSVCAARDQQSRRWKGVGHTEGGGGFYAAEAHPVPPGTPCTFYLILLLPLPHPSCSADYDMFVNVLVLRSGFKITSVHNSVWSSDSDVDPKMEDQESVHSPLPAVHLDHGWSISWHLLASVPHP